MGAMRNVTLSNIVATGASKVGCAIAGLPGHPIENLSLSDINLSFDGGGIKAEAAREIPELPDKYPECKMFGTLPAYGLFCRHVKGLRLSNVQLRTAAADLRPAVVCDDVDGLSIDGLDAKLWPGAEPALRLRAYPKTRVGAGRGKGDRHLLCEAPEGPFRQKVPVTFSPRGSGIGS
jgi:hypothetical protein